MQDLARIDVLPGLKLFSARGDTGCESEVMGIHDVKASSWGYRM